MYLLRRKRSCFQEEDHYGQYSRGRRKRRNQDYRGAGQRKPLPGRNQRKTPSSHQRRKKQDFQTGRIGSVRDRTRFAFDRGKRRRGRDSDAVGSYDAQAPGGRYQRGNHKIQRQGNKKHERYGRFVYNRSRGGPEEPQPPAEGKTRYHRKRTHPQELSAEERVSRQHIGFVRKEINLFGKSTSGKIRESKLPRRTENRIFGKTEKKTEL